MSVLSLYESITAQVSVPAFFAQALLILFVIFYGYLLLTFLCPSLCFGKRVLFAYPAGLAVFVLESFLLVTLGVPYGTWSVVIVYMALLLAVALFSVLRSPAGERRERLCGPVRIGIKEALIAALLIITATALSCSGLLRVTLSNDSMYNYWFYPRLIVHFKGIRSNFNTFLTDVGQGVALIDTLPFLFGFEESFGIQHMLNLVFTGTFFMALYELPKDLSVKFRRLFAVSGTLLLLVTLPYLLLSKWVLANDYFAVYMFLCTYLVCSLQGREKDKRQEIRLLYLFVAALSVLRIEGGICALLLILCFSVLDFLNKELALGMLLPVFCLQILYAYRIFFTMSIIAPYQFLTKEKEILQLAMMAAGFVYLMWIRQKVFVKIQKFMPLLIPTALMGINLLLMIRDPGMYVDNMRAFVQNILHHGGWGVFPATILVLYLISIGRSFKFSFTDLIAFSYLLYVLAVSFMREGGMKAGVGDSGNRVLLQIVPVLLFAAMSHVAVLFEKHEKQT